MIYLQHELVEETIRRKQSVLRHHDLTDAGKQRLARLDEQAHTAATIAAIKFADDKNFALLVSVLEQLCDEIAGARDAVENERAMRRI